MIDSKYSPRIPLLWVEDDAAVVKALKGELLKRNIYGAVVDNLEDAVDILKKIKVDLLISDGMYPRKAGETEAKSFIPLMEKLALISQRSGFVQSPRIMAWANSTHVHEYCKKHRLESYSKYVLTRKMFKEKGRKFIKVRRLSAAQMADLIAEKLDVINGLKKGFGNSKLSFYYGEPGTVLALAMAADMRTGHFKKTAGLNYKPMVSVIKDGELAIYMNPVNDGKIAQSIFRKFNRPGFFNSVKKNIDVAAKSLLTFARGLREKQRGKQLSRLSNGDLGKMYKNFCDLFISMRVYSSLPTALEHGTNLWTEKLQRLLARKISNKVEKNKVLSVLTSPEKNSYVQDFDLELAKVGLERAKGKPVKRALEGLAGEYAWINYAFQGTPLKISDLEVRLGQIGKTAEDFGNFIKAGSERIMRLKKEKIEIIKKYGFKKDELKFFEIGAEIVFIKFFRKGVFAESYYNVEFLSEEIGRRIGCKRDQVVNLTPEEVLSALIVGRFSGNLADARMKSGVLAHLDGRTFFASARVPAQRNKFYHLKEEVLSDGKKNGKVEVRGQAACTGFAKGRVKLVNVPADMLAFKAGDILVSRSTNPSLLAAMRKAGAIVTDVGGLTCHAAIVAREMRKPCVIGTKNATMVLKNGDLVEVDADQGVVRVVN